MGLCGSKVGPEGGGKVSPRRKPRRQSTSASSMRSNLVQVDKKNDITEVFDIDGGDVLGSGATSTVRTCRHKKTGKVYALKTIRLNRMNKSKKDMLLQEVELMRQMDHPYIVKIVATFHSFQTLHMVMECCNGGELFDKLYDQPGTKFTEPDCAAVAVKMLAAVNYLHSMDVCHRDLKLENFIFTEKGPKAEIKMIDFGFSKHYLHKEHMHEVVGTSYYIAPEVLNRDYTQKSDIWSLGVIFFMMLCGRCPFGGNDDYEIQENVRNGNYSFKSKHWRGISTDAKNFVRSLLDMNPESRPTAADALKHPWITSGGTGMHDATDSSEVDEAIGNSIKQVQQYREFSRLKKMALMSVAIGMEDREVEQMKLAFQEFDVQKNGTISLNEFRTVMKKSNFLQDQDIESVFADLDLDKTGFIKYSEFLAAALKEQTFLEDDRVVDAFNKLDTDHNGTITRENLKSILGNELNDDAIDRMIAEADFHKDGVIHLDEFRMMMEGKKAPN